MLLLRARDGRQWRFTLDDLRRLPARRLRTALPAALGMTGASDWEGVPLSALVALAGPPPQAVSLTALNAYAVNVPGRDLARYDPVLAYRRDGQDIAVRDKGPLILIYPFDRFPAELNTQAYINRTIWQVHEIVLE
ncbi:molybdopterin-dependent oxidoreductase [Mitsuaria sp. GD03876]|uniref:molybdopterin-dependent oxidoreductase n=1 Tax=Mitsuaria sp. GD03876 TaxID=2975399 RepID=UPI002449D784|nr:molybdopterin-dependent oxidoreductase [Mitsuaria sp. GD03876]MDH0867941.1 molybdopterin-dependent oxidoreductase [Mitsuaria sp. GD03876]